MIKEENRVKKTYLDPEMAIEKMENEDVIVTSPEVPIDLDD